MSSPPPDRAPVADAISVVGIGADGWAGLTDHVRHVVASADVLVGGERHLELVPVHDVTKLSWPRPFRGGLRDLLVSYRGHRIVILASGDPLLSGAGGTLVELLGRDAVRVLPTVSSVALARARLRWTAEETETVSVVGRNPHRVSRALAPGRRLLVLSADGSTPATIAALLVERGYGRSHVTVLESLGSDDERRVDGEARAWEHPAGASLNIVAVECEIDPGTTLLSQVPGLSDDAFEHDGQLTRRDLRASCLARLVPAPGQLLWDVGAGSGSVAIEWMRAHPANRAVAVESRPERAVRVRCNAKRLGVPDLRVVEGRAPQVLAELGTPLGPPEHLDASLRPPDAVFLGGGVSSPGMVDACLGALASRGRIVAHAVTVEAEAALVAAHAKHGGELVRHVMERAAPLGRFTGWEPARTVTQWSLTKGEDR